MTTEQAVLRQVYTAENHEKLMDTYKEWASEYERDTVEGLGYVGHLVAAKAVQKHVLDKSAYVLDAGCGTGLVGLILDKVGFTNLAALDYSKEMLDEARLKGIYRSLIQADLSKALHILDNTYDAVVCAGTFTYGHVGASAFEELCRITRPGGHICFSIRDGAYEDYGYRERMLTLEKDQVWELIEMREEDYLQKEGVTCKMSIYKVL